VKRITGDQREAYARYGVVFPLPVLTSAETELHLRSFEEWRSAAGGRLSPMAMRHPHLFQRWAYDLATLPAVLDAVEDILGPDILVHSTTMFCKFPGDGSWVSWHQDGFYLGLSASGFTSA